MDDNELLLRHAEKWAGERKRTFDRDLVETAIDLRATHDGLDANKWPADSARHLMLSRWPSHGPVGVPDVAALVDSLDSFWRFLRTTGRMGGGSAEPAALAKEAKQAAKKMAAACADERNHGAAKSMLSFGAEIGIGLDDVPDLETMNERLQQIQAAWNALPADERRRRSPGLDGLGKQALAGGMHWDEEYDDGLSLELNDAADSAPYFLASDYLASLRALVDWVGDGRPITDTGVLKPAVAREAYEALDLWAWDRGWQRSTRPTRAAHTNTSDEAEAANKRAALHSWHSALDCVPLARLWEPAVSVGLIELKSTKAVAHPEQWPTDDEAWAALGMHFVHMLFHVAEDVGVDEPLLPLLFTVDARRGSPLKTAALPDWWWQDVANPVHELKRSKDDHELLEIMRPISDESLAGCLAFFADLGLWQQRAGYLIGTEFGWDNAVTLGEEHDPSLDHLADLDLT